MPSSNQEYFFFGWSCYSYYLVLYVLSLHILDTNTRSSPHWKLVVENGKSTIVPNPVTGGNFMDNPNNTVTQNLKRGGGFVDSEEDDVMFQILASTVVNSGAWMKNGKETYCASCPMGQHLVSGGVDGTSSSLPGMDEMQQSRRADDDTTQEPLECGKPTNFTYYDQLMGIANRHNHPHIPEPQVAMIFRKKGSKKDTIDLNTLEKKLRKAKNEKPSSVQLYNQIGNFNRIKGHTLRAIECFRRALAVAPNNPEILLNLARLLLTLQYLDDSLFLARRSLELQAPDKNTWAQHFALGEILKAYGHHQEAVLHFKHTLELRPDHEGALEELRQIEAHLAGSGFHVSTLVIILFLVIAVLIVICSGYTETDEAVDSSRPTPRHFSRALAMRSLKLGISPRALRAKRSA